MILITTNLAFIFSLSTSESTLQSRYAILAFALLMVLLIWLYDHMSPFGFYGRRMHAALRCACKQCEAFRSNKEAVGSEDEDECLFETRLCDPSENNEGLIYHSHSPKHLLFSL